MGDQSLAGQLNISNINKSFGSLSVLHNVNLTLDRGEFVAVVGKSGCGKSTLLRLIAGLESVTDGEIQFDSEPVKGIHPEIRVLFQDPRLLPWKKVIDNVRIGMPRVDRAIAAETLKRVGLEDRADEWPNILSGGQKQRVALARAVVSKPRVLLLDEPLGALDALTRIEMQQWIERLWLEHRFTVMLVTHDVSEAVSLADRVVVIEEGKIGLDLKITLPRPRERDSGFAHFEKLILDRLLTKPNYPQAQSYNI